MVTKGSSGDVVAKRMELVLEKNYGILGWEALFLFFKLENTYKP